MAHKHLEKGVASPFLVCFVNDLYPYAWHDANSSVYPASAQLALP
jgi:hypothetical protein